MNKKPKFITRYFLIILILSSMVGLMEANKLLPLHWLVSLGMTLPVMILAWWWVWTEATN